MRYQDRIDEIFKEYKDTTKARKLKDEVLKKYGARYMNLAREQGNHKAQEVLARELNSIRQKFPQLARLPKVNDTSDRLPRVATIIGIIVLAGVIAGTFLWRPFIGMIVQFGVGFLLIPLSRGLGLNHPKKQDKVLPTLYALFLAIPPIMFTISYNDSSESGRLITTIMFYGLTLLLYSPIYIMTAFFKERILNRKWMWFEVLRFDHSQDSLDFLTFLAFDLMTIMICFLTYFLTYGIEWFETWFTWW